MQAHPQQRDTLKPPDRQEAPHPVDVQDPPPKSQPVHIDRAYTLTHEQALLSLHESRLLSVGNMMGIVSGIGTGKSHLCELFAALWIAPDCESNGSLDGVPDGMCLYVDTERPANDCFRGFKRMCRRIDAEAHPEYLTPNRMDFQRVRVESFISLESPEAKQGALGELIHAYVKQGLRLLIIDGILDLCANPNNIEEATRLAHRLLALANTYKFGMIYTIHGNRNDSSGKGKGWIGDVFQRKSESFLRLARVEGSEVRVLTSDFENSKIRNGPDKVCTGFQWSDEQHMFVEVPYSFEGKENTMGYPERFAWAFSKVERPARFSDLETVYTGTLKMSKKTLQRDLTRAFKEKMISKDAVGRYHFTQEGQQRIFHDDEPFLPDAPIR